MRTGVKWILSIVVAVLGAAAVGYFAGRSVVRGVTGSDRSEAITQVEGALTQACDQLAQSTPENVFQNWGSVRKVIATTLRRQLWIRDGLAWFDLRKLEGVMTACGIRDEAARAHLAALAKSGHAAALFQDERREFCRFGQGLAEVNGGAAWADDQRSAWDAACVRMLSGPVSGSAPAAAAPAATAPAGSPAPPAACANDLRSKQPAMADQSLAADGWLAYGRTLAACGPDAKPWETLSLIGGREQFVDDYVAPFLNGDALRNSAFRTAETAQYDRIVSSWGLGE